MRKETLIYRIIAIVITIWLTYISLRYLFGSKQNYTPLNDQKQGNMQYPMKNVYSKPMTKLEIRHELGRSTWTLLHTMAAVYPGIPSAEHKKDVLHFIYLLSKLYPCGDCAQHFQKLLENFPPKVGNHDEFAGWMCQAHNVVNKRLGKPEFDCQRVDERWECGCDAVEK